MQSLLPFVQQIFILLINSVAKKRQLHLQRQIQISARHGARHNQRLASGITVADDR
jgi:hypothetical protein